MDKKTNRPSNVSRLRTGITLMLFLGIALVGGFLLYRQQNRYQEGAEKIASVRDGISYTVRDGQIFFHEDGASNAGPMMASAVAVPGTPLPEPVFTMQALSLSDGSRREVVHESMTKVSVSDTLPVDGAVLYVTQAQGAAIPSSVSSAPVSAPPRMPFGGRRTIGPAVPILPGPEVRVSAPFNFSGGRYFVHGARPKTGGQPLPTTPRDFLRSTEPVILNRRPVNGDPTVKTPLDTGGYSIRGLTHVLTEEGLYWVRPVPKERYYAERKSAPISPPPVPRRSLKGGPMRAPGPQAAPPPSTYRVEEIYEGDDLMLSPLDGGPARKRASGLVIDSLSVTEDALYITGLCPTPGHTRAIYRILRRDNSPPVNLHNFPSGDESNSYSPVQSSAPPLDIAGRLYWMERYQMEDDETSSIVNQQTGRVVSSRPDGSDRRVIWEARDTTGKIMFPKQIFASQGKLYLVFTQVRITPVPPPEELKIEFSHSIARLNPERTPALGAIQALPRSTNVNSMSGVLPRPIHTADGHFYFVTRAETKSALDFLSSRTTAGYATALCRVKLPE
jgi:hypothetical protein